LVSVTVTEAPEGTLGALTVRVGPVTVSVAGEEVPPPGAGVKTLIVRVPAVAMSLAGIAAVSWVGETNVVGRALPSTCTTELPTKFVPVAVSVKAGLPSATAVGLMLVRVGGGGGEVTGKDWLFDVQFPPPQGVGFTTVIVSVPTLATSPARTVAVS